MKRILILAAMAMLFAACGPKAPKVLVLFYSQTDHTRTVAQEIQKALGADIEEVFCVNPYDGTYQETINRAGEERAKGIFPELEPIKADISIGNNSSAVYEIAIRFITGSITKLMV